MSERSESPVDWQQVRDEFPLLARDIHQKQIIYFDNANTTQKPQVVIDAVQRFYQTENANVSRAVHTLGTIATEAYEQSRIDLANFLHVPAHELVLCSGTTFALNLVAYSWALPRLAPGDVIVISRMEHHANIVPWQLIAQRTGARIDVLEMTPEGCLDLTRLDVVLHERVKIVALAHVSNVLGTVNPVKQVCQWARQRGIVTVIDGSQAAPHLAVDVSSLGCDFYAVTGHKIFGPTGTGALWARQEHWQAMAPFCAGGEMIREVSFDGTTFNEPPHKFEAGTPNIAGFVGLSHAVQYLRKLGLSVIHAREAALLQELTNALAQVDGLHILGTAPDKTAIVTFVIDGVHAHDLATLLDLDGIAVRSGQHCTHPLMQFYGVSAACRASLAFYNTFEEIALFVASVQRICQRLR